MDFPSTTTKKLRENGEYCPTFSFTTVNVHSLTTSIAWNNIEHCVPRRYIDVEICDAVLTSPSDPHINDEISARRPSIYLKFARELVSSMYRSEPSPAWFTFSKPEQSRAKCRYCHSLRCVVNSTPIIVDKIFAAVTWRSFIICDVVEIIGSIFENSLNGSTCLIASGHRRGFAAGYHRKDSNNSECIDLGHDTCPLSICSQG